ncbi:MAG: hypothetical protein EA359_03800 [Balneolaceae bacterium]|nr:MAG: hypothetical protein EA359_03800 [Balneolaceae bacterium]
MEVEFGRFEPHTLLTSFPKFKLYVFIICSEISLVISRISKMSSFFGFSNFNYIISEESVE